MEVRVEHDLKDALMQRAQTEGRSASDIVRESIGTYLARPEKETRVMQSIWKPAAALAAGTAAILWVGLAGTPAVAMPDLKALFEAMDRDNDNKVSMDEFANHAQDHMVHVGPPAGAHPPAGRHPIILPLRRDAGPPPPGGMAPPPEVLKSHFAEQDGNKDGKVDYDEFRAHHHRIMEASFGAIDDNGDGSIDRAEYEAKVRTAPGTPRAPAFGEIDTNGDGRVTEAEYFPPA